MRCSARSSKSATIISMDDAIGDLRTGDVLVEGSRIVDVRPSIDLGSGAAETEIVDGSGRIVIPGLINAHMHTWQTALRGYAANWTLLEYFRRMHAGLATVFRPDDIYIATLVGALNQINCGTTTLVDWCHNNPTPAHTDAAVRGLIESGIRAAFFHGSPKPEPKPGEPHFSEIPHPRREVERLLAGPLADRDGLVTLGLAILGPHYSTLDVAMHDFRLARELDLIASMHQGGGPRQDTRRLGEADRGRPRRRRHQHRPWQRSARRSPQQDGRSRRLLLGDAGERDDPGPRLSDHRTAAQARRAPDHRDRPGIRAGRRSLLRRPRRAVDAAGARQCGVASSRAAPFRRPPRSPSARRCAGSRPKAPACSAARARSAR